MVLYFWGIGCKNAEKEARLLQQEYDLLRRQPSSDTLLISSSTKMWMGAICKGVGNSSGKNGVTTLPVMVDLSCS